MSFSSRSKIGAFVVALAGTFAPGSSDAEPLRLRGDALVQTRSPVGLLVLRGEDRLRPWLDVETVTWMGATAGGGPVAPSGDVLTLSVRARDVASGSEVRAGRMIVSMGAVRPVQIDGARALGRVFGGSTLEAFGGVPVVRIDQGAIGAERTFAFTAGGRLGQAYGFGAIGASYAVRRRGASRDDEEVGADVVMTPAPWFTAAGRAALDLLTRGPTDALVSVSVKKSDLRAEVFTTHRSPGRLLPSTSLFSVLGDFAATSSGSTLRWRAFPRLELVATGSVQAQASEVGGQGIGRASLALDDEWEGSVGVELRRVDFGGARWSGARTTVSLPFGGAFRAAAELEIVRPDDPRGGSDLWPWALGAISWTSASGWELASGIEASSGRTYREAIHGLARLSYAYDRPRLPARRGP
jgi:hypothetical protein